MQPQSSIPKGFCQCGCGQRTTVAYKTNTAKGIVKGQPRRFLSGHNQRVHTDLAEALWSQVDKSGDCWLWTGTDRIAGYGRIGIGKKRWRAHRLAWVLTFGPIPEGLEVCHSCDNPPCCNPKHLFLGTQAANNRDCIAKGRARHRALRGEASPNANLTAEKVQEIRRLRAEEGWSYGRLARKFRVPPGTIPDIIKRRTWAHLP